VGTNTEWGQLMANLSEDNGEETPLQVILCKDSANSRMDNY
jgi:P-type Ca2+ transporter type 2C